MDEGKNNQPLKKSKKKSHKKIRGRKRKTRVTREYQDNEIEVQRLLEQMSLSVVLSNATTTPKIQAKTNLSESIEFFCKKSDETSNNSNRKTQFTATEKNESAVEYEISDEEDEEEKSVQTDAHNYSDEVQSSTSAHASVTRSTHPTNTAASFIHIDLEDEPVIRAEKVKEKLSLNSDLLYIPKKFLDASVRKLIGEDAPRMEANTARLLNRYYVEHGKDCAESFAEIVRNVLQDDRNHDSRSDKQVYRTSCDYIFHPIFCDPGAEAVSLPTRTFIKLHLKELRFTDHEYLQEEHRLVNLLSDYYEAYTEQFKLKTCEKLSASLHAERKIINDLLQREAAATDTNAEHNTDTRLSQERRAAILGEHLLNVQQQRTQLYQTEASKRRLIKQMLKTWIELKKLREEQRWQCTRFRLRIHVREDEVDARSLWQQRYENDLNEVMREELEAYYRAKREWRQQQARRSESDPATKPKKPNVDKLARVVKRQLIDSIGQPSEPKIDLFWSRMSDEEFNELSSASGPSMQRRPERSYFMKLFFDGQLVGMTRSYRLEPDLTISMNETIGIFLERRLPKDIKISLFEKMKLPKLPFKIANIIVPLPLGSDSKDFQTQNVSFSSHKFPTSGRLQLRFECENNSCIYPDDMVKVLFPPPKERAKLQQWNTKELGQRLPEDSQEPDTRKKWKDDYDDVEVFDVTSKMLQRSRLETCTFQEDLLKFCSMEELNHNPRFRVLSSRYQKQDPSTRGLRLVPALDHELDCDDSDDDAEEAVIDAGNWMDPIDVHKHEGKKYLKILYEAIQNQCGKLSKVIESSENLLIGDETVTIRTFLQSLLRLLSPKYPLNPSRNISISSSHSPRTIEALSVNQNFTIVLNVVRATGIPIRGTLPSSDHTENRQHSGTGTSSMLLPLQTFKYSNVRPFVALSYSDKLCRSLTAEGSNPTWNEELQLQFNANPADLRDDVKILLFDEVIENRINDDAGSRSMDVYQRIQTNWLGEYRIPISTLLKHAKIEGVFELNTPRVLLGYRYLSFDGIPSTSSDTTILVDQLPEIKKTIHLWFYISLAPTLDLPNLSSNCLECSELRVVRQHLMETCYDIKEIQPNHFIDPLVCSADGKRVCITRLLEAIPLPMEKCDNWLAQVCRFVSLLHVIKGYDAAVTGFNGVWLNNQTLLDTTWGAPKDLGVLLASFMLSMGISCSVVLCLAHPYGQSAFVLYRLDNETDLMLADPCTGRRYCVNDVFCPITKVDCIITTDNFYFNIQSETRIAMMNFNVKESAFWAPAFNRRNPAPLGGVHQLKYMYTQCFATSELRKNIERKIMKKISTWRSMRKTIWNRAFQMRLQSILADLETNATLSSGKDEEKPNIKHAEQLAAEFPNYRLYGFTLNFSYTNLSAISDRVRATGIHLNSHKNVEFSLAVHIFPYTNNVLSIWLFLISLLPNDKQ